MTPIKGPKIAPLRITIGSVGMGVAERIPIKMMEIRGPITPVSGIIPSIFFKSRLKIIIRITGTAKVMRAMMALRVFFPVLFFINKYIIAICI